MGGLLEGKRVLITGVLDRRSIAYSAARLAAEQGAQIVLSGFGRAKNLTARTAKRLDPEPPVLELDVNKPEDIEAVADDLRERWGELDGVVHAVDGVEFVKILRIYETNVITGEQAAKPAGTHIVLEPDELIASGAHIVKASHGGPSDGAPQA